MLAIEKEGYSCLMTALATFTADKEGLFGQACGEETEHRLTKPGTPKTNGMVVERANLTIKSATIHRTTYLSYGELSSSSIRLSSALQPLPKTRKPHERAESANPYGRLNQMVGNPPRTFFKKI